MYRLIVSISLIAAITCQQQEGARRVPKYAGDPKTAAIVQEARYLNGNGAFGAAYQQEDGINFKEETDADGNRKGSYSYIDPSGQRKTVNYIAGKNGFQAIGDHIPTAPLPVAPTPGYEPDPRYNSPDYKSQQYNAPQQYTAPVQSRNYAGPPSVDDGQYHPELYEQNNEVVSQPRYQAQPQYQQPQQQYQPQPEYQAQPQPQPHYQPNSIYTGVQQAQYSGLQNQQYSEPAPQHQYYEQTTPPPARFFPPGKFSLNRGPDGFSYSFHKA